MYSILYFGHSSSQSVAPASPKSDEIMETSTLTQSVIPANESNLTTSHCLSNDAVAGIVVGAAVGLAIITALVIFFCMRRKRHPRSRRRHHRSLDGPQVPRKTRDRPAVVEIPNTSSVLENYLPQSADDSTVERRARTTLEQIGFHVDNFYQSQSVVASSKSDDGLTGFDSPYLPAPLMTLLSQSKDTIPLIVHALAYFVILSLSPFKHSKHSLLPIEFVTLPSSVGFLEASGSTKAGKISFWATTGHSIVYKRKS